MIDLIRLYGPPSTQATKQSKKPRDQKISNTRTMAGRLSGFVALHPYITATGERQRQALLDRDCPFNRLKQFNLGTYMLKEDSKGVYTDPESVWTKAATLHRQLHAGTDKGDKIRDAVKRLKREVGAARASNWKPSRASKRSIDMEL